MITKIKFTLAATAVSGLAIGAAQAATCDILNFTESTACISPIAGNQGGNVTADLLNSISAFGSTSWMEIAALNEPSTISSDSVFSITYDDASNSKSGTWTLNPPNTWGSGLYAFAVKGGAWGNPNNPTGNPNAVYLMDTSVTSGTWTVSDLLNPGGQIPDLSNMRLFGTTDVAPIPLPAAGFLLLGALGGLGLIAGRRKNTA